MVLRGKKVELSDLEKELIDKWIKVEDLNQLGDPSGTMYPGCTPLVDPIAGYRLYQDRFAYIVDNHPGKPWLNE